MNSEAAQSLRDREGHKQQGAGSAGESALADQAQASPAGQLRTTRTRFILNQDEVETAAPAGLLVLDFVRGEGLTGTKEGCKEGDCGACAILIGELDGDTVRYQPVTSCLVPLAEVHGKHVVTIEGCNLAGLGPVQRAIVEQGATQCGFCTPGIVVSLQGLLLDDSKGLGLEDVKYALSGHLCRCTGYRSLKDCAALLEAELGPALAGTGGSNGSSGVGGGMGGSVGDGAQRETDSSTRSSGAGGSSGGSAGDGAERGTGSSGGRGVGGGMGGTGNGYRVAALVAAGALPDYFTTIPTRLRALRAAVAGDAAAGAAPPAPVPGTAGGAASRTVAPAAPPPPASGTGDAEGSGQPTPAPGARTASAAPGAVTAGSASAPAAPAPHVPGSGQTLPAGAAAPNRTGGGLAGTDDPDWAAAAGASVRGGAASTATGTTAAGGAAGASVPTGTGVAATEAVLSGVDGDAGSAAEAAADLPELRIAGGTDLYVQQGEQIPDRRVAVLGGRPELKGIRLSAGGEFRIGGLTTFEEFGTDPQVRAAIPAIASFNHLIASWQIRNRATLAGNIVNASPIGDFTALLLALDARIVLATGSATRSVPLRKFYRGYKQIDLRPDEILTEVVFADPTAARVNFEKVSKRTCLDIATVNSACKLELPGTDDAIAAAHFSLGGVAPIPLYLEQTAAAVRGRTLTPDTVWEAVRVSQREIAPISDVRGSAEYKRLLARQLMLAHFLTLFPERFSAQAFLAEASGGRP